MSSLDTLLTEVGPILNSSQFTHPSFREVLTAKQCAEEINSGKLSVRDAYLDLWSCFESNKPQNLPADYRIISSRWRPVLTHLSTMLSESSADEFIRIVSENYLMCKEQIDMFSKEDFADFVLEDLALCARCIGEHPALHGRDTVRQVLDSLLDVGSEFYDWGNQCNVWERSDFSRKALRFTNSSYVVTKLVSYVNGCRNIPDYGYNIDDARLSSAMVAHNTVRELIGSGTKIDEALFIENIKSEPSIECSFDFHIELSLLSDFGSVSAYEGLVDFLSDDWFVNNFSSKHEEEQVRNYFSQIFKMVKRHGFEPRLIDLLNGKVSHVRAGELMARYHTALFSFAQSFKEESGVDLYNHLEKNKMQFWDYWMVYKPK